MYTLNVLAYHFMNTRQTEIHKSYMHCFCVLNVYEELNKKRERIQRFYHENRNIKTRHDMNLKVYLYYTIWVRILFNWFILEMQLNALNARYQTSNDFVWICKWVGEMPNDNIVKNIMGVGEWISTNDLKGIYYILNYWIVLKIIL